MEIKKDELVLLLPKDAYDGKQVLAYAKNFSCPMNIQELVADTISSTLLHMIIEKTGKRPKDLVNKSDDFYQKEVRGKDLDLGEWVRLLKKKPGLIAAPIAFYKGKAVVCQPPSAILNLNAPI